MKFWTIQSNSINDIIVQDGIYQPLFCKSRWLIKYPEYRNLYHLVLDSFNRINHYNNPGLVFAFAQVVDKKIVEIDNINSLRTIIQNNKSYLQNFLNELDKTDMTVFELESKGNFNPIFIDFNDFQFLMPPYFFASEVEQLLFDKLNESITTGKPIISKYAISLIQAHLPNIKSENIVHTYSILELL